MKTVRVGYGRLYNARGCSLFGRDEVLLKFAFGIIDVEAYVGPNPRHIIAGFKIGPAEAKDSKVCGRASRAREYELPSPEKFPADLYTELVATESIEVDDALATAFHGHEEAARAEMLRRAEEMDSSLTTALDYVAGVLGLFVHNILVRTPITEQRYAYRERGSYAISASLGVKVIPSHEWDVSDEGLTATKSRMPKLLREWTWEKAAEVLAWLVRAWASEDPVLEFVSLFIPLELVIPEAPRAEREQWDQKRKAVLAIIERETAALDRNELLRFVNNLQPPPTGLASRFKTWATDEALPGWKNDVEKFRPFNRMRNTLLHAGKTDGKSRVSVEDYHVRTLEHIAARYVSLALFGRAVQFSLR
jgi:hypothetical protein